MSYPAAYITPLLARKFTYIGKDDVVLINWCGHNLDIQHLIYGTDMIMRRTQGLIMTTSSIKELESRKSSGRWTGNLYIKARTELGLWEITLPKTHIKELGRQAYWFDYKDVVTHKILQK
tara:strand:+ start:571 stop:930 length:360 start_codon:yes stop_codon:yes gene_type:complete